MDLDLNSPLFSLAFLRASGNHILLYHKNTGHSEEDILKETLLRNNCQSTHSGFCLGKEK